MPGQATVGTAAGGDSQLLAERWPGLPQKRFWKERDELSTFFPNTPFLSPSILVSLDHFPRRGPGRAEGLGGAPVLAAASPSPPGRHPGLRCWDVDRETTDTRAA